VGDKMKQKTRSELYAIDVLKRVDEYFDRNDHCNNVAMCLGSLNKMQIKFLSKYYVLKKELFGYWKFVK
jgi:hypothetical protein